MQQTSLGLLGIIVTAAATPLAVRQPYDSNNTSQNMVYSYQDVPVSADLKWVPCYDNFTCANLEVPLDYEDPEVGTTQIAFIKFESPEQPVKGDILINPGGPANSATGGMLADIAGIVTLLGTSYNIVGMDPRAVNNSGPNGDCFPGATYDRDFYNSYVLSVNHDPTDAASLKDYWHRAGTLDEWCSQTLNETARYITTMATARDMLQYFEKLAESKDENPDEAKVNLYGTSYGTVLGTTFARIYPDRVGRFILDGVVDGIDYYNGQWLTTLLQADEAIADFFVKCEEAGPLCTFFRNDTAAEMQKRFDAILADLEKNRIWITDPAMVNYPTYVTDLDLRAVTIGLLYNALTGYPVLDVIFTGLETRNATVLYYAMSGYNVNKGKVPTEADISTAYAEGQPTYEVRLPRLSITCNDMNGQYNISSPEMFEEYAKKQFEASKYLAHGFAGLVSVNCWNWKFKPSESQIFPGYEETETAPILFLANTIDPVSASQDLMLSFYPGSGLLLQDHTGHGSVGAPSNCTSGYVQKFLDSGELPPEGEIFKTNDRPFFPPEGAA